MDSEEVLSVFVKPNSEKNEVIGLYNGSLKIKICCPPEKNKANKELISFLSRKIGLPKKNFSILSGHHSNTKKILIKKDFTESVLKKILVNN